MAGLTQGQKNRITNIRGVQIDVSTLGSILGVVYAARTGGKWYRYIGYYILGGLILGVPTSLATTPMINDIIKESEEEKIIETPK